MIRWLAIALIAAPAAMADSLTVTRAIRPATILDATDIAVLSTNVPGALSSRDEAVGLEAKVTLYPGRAIRPGDLGLPALVDRNQLVEIVYRTDTLTIRTEGRALDRGAVGDRVRVMNLSSRSTVSGVVTDGGLILIVPFGARS